MRDLERYRNEFKKALPRLIFGMSFLFVIVQIALAALNVAGHFFLGHLKHS